LPLNLLIIIYLDDDDDDEEESDTGSGKGEGENGQNKEPVEKEPKQPSIGDYIMHFISLFWKLLFAFVPPTGKYINF
jgi:solute carrier family 8 (sodium/calcium exchanger)